MITQLFKLIWTQRIVNAWIWVELLIVFVCLSYVVDYLYVTGRTYFTPLGYDTEHVYRVDLASVSSQSNEFLPQVTDSMNTEYLLRILDRMRAYPGVEEVSLSKQTHPYNRSTRNGVCGIDTTWVWGYMYVVSPEFFRVFRISDQNGQVEPLVAAAKEERSEIISASASREFSKVGINALNTGIKYFSETVPSHTVRGICTDVRFDEFSNMDPKFYLCLSDAQILKSSATNTEFCLRVRPDIDTPDFANQFRKQMKSQLRLGNIYLMDIVSFADLRTNYYRNNGAINEVKTYIAGLSFLLLNILLGVVGTFWIRTQQRRSEIAVRIAMGASRANIRSLLVGEGLVLLLFAALPAMVIGWNIAFALIDSFVEEGSFLWARFLAGQGITFILMAVMVIAGVYLPARQAMKIQPAEALHEEG